MFLFMELKLSALGLDRCERKVTILPGCQPEYMQLVDKVWQRVDPEPELLEAARTILTSAMQ